MDVCTAIEQRISRRSFLEEPIAADVLETLCARMAQINAESGLNCTFLEDGRAAFEGGKSYGMFRGVKAMLVFKGAKNMEHLYEKVGYYGEALVLLATSLGLGSCWVGGTFDPSALAADADEEIVCVVPLGVVSEKSSLKERFMRGVIHRKSKSVAELIESDWPLDAPMQRAMTMVQRAPSARNTQKVQFTRKDGIVRAAVPNDYRFDLVDLGIAKLHFICAMGGRFAFGNDGAWQQET